MGTEDFAYGAYPWSLLALNLFCFLDKPLHKSIALGMRS